MLSSPWPCASSTNCYFPGGGKDSIMEPHHVEICCIQPDSRGGPDWGCEGMRKDTDTREKLGLNGVGSVMEMPQHPRISSCLLYTIQQGGGATAYNKQGGGAITILSSIKEAGFHSSQEEGKSPQHINIWREKTMMDIFCVHCHHPQKPKDFAIPVSLIWPLRGEGWGGAEILPQS